MSFLNDYLFYNQDNECPRDYHFASALVILAAAAGRRVYWRRGYSDIHPMLYVTLVGKQGTRKSTAKDIAMDLFCEALPDIPVGSATQSKEQIVQFMASADCMRAMNINGEPIEYRPMVFFINELKNWLSYNPGGMIAFLTDIYDRKYFDSATIKRGLEKIINPCVNILACETPEWIIDQLKMKIISGGFTRRMLYVYKTDAEQTERIAFPTTTPEMEHARTRCIKHLQMLQSVSGEFKWDPVTKATYKKWYDTLPVPPDETMAGYYRSKHDQLIKVMMCLALQAPEPRLVFTNDLFELGLAFLDKIEVNMPLLSVAAGRNELAVPQQRILEILKNHNGYIRKKILHTLLDKDLEPREQWSLMEHLSKTTGLIRIVKIHRNGPTGLPFEEVWLSDAFADAIASKQLILEGQNIFYQNGK